MLEREGGRYLLRLEERLHKSKGVVGSQQKREVQFEQAKARGLGNMEAVRIAGAAQENIVGLVGVVLAVELVRTRAVKNVYQLVVRVPV